MYENSSAHETCTLDTPDILDPAPDLSILPPVIFDPSIFTVDNLLEAKGELMISVCIPARDEARTIGQVIQAIAHPHLRSKGGSGLIDEILVIDDRSQDSTSEKALSTGAKVISLDLDLDLESAQNSKPGKGEAMAVGLAESIGDIIVFLDADVENTTDLFITGLVGPLLLHPEIMLVKGFYERPLHGAPSGGGRVTELVARPLIELLFPALSNVRQPLAGETASHRWVLDKIGFARGYGVELGLLIDTSVHFGTQAIAQVDLGTRIHRNRPLDQLRPQAVDIIRTALSRTDRFTDPQIDR